MRLQEFANAEAQISLWKLISDSVWQSIKQQAIEQEKNKKASKKSKPSKKSKSVAQPKPVNTNRNQKSSKSIKQQKSAPQTQKPQALPKVFTSTLKSNAVAPQSPVNSVASVPVQNAATANSVAQTQNQLYPLANSEVVKKLTS